MAASVVLVLAVMDRSVTWMARWQAAARRGSDRPDCDGGQPPRRSSRPLPCCSIPRRSLPPGSPSAPPRLKIKLERGPVRRSHTE